jgi:uncharacterized damage-inducible protein DinB
MSLIKSVNDFLEAWKYESSATVKVFNNLTDESLKQKVTPEGRSLGFLAWHITQTIGEMMSKTGLDFPGFEEHALAPASAIEIKNQYEKLSAMMVEQVEKNWKDEMLQDEINMYGQMWKRADVLASLNAHQAHHRAQMTVLMRQAGLRVPGVYGPSKEEWAEFGMPAME